MAPIGTTDTKILTSKANPTDVGKTYIMFSLLPTIPIDPPQPCKVVREVSRQEFIDYWKNRDLVNYEDSIVKCGEPPLDFNYYEVAVD